MRTFLMILHLLQPQEEGGKYDLCHSNVDCFHLVVLCHFLSPLCLCLLTVSLHYEWYYCITSKSLLSVSLCVSPPGMFCGIIL